jgi:hypothetical protein
LVALRPNRGAIVRSLSADDAPRSTCCAPPWVAWPSGTSFEAALVTDEVLASLTKLEQRAYTKSNKRRQAAMVDAFQTGIIGGLRFAAHHPPPWVDCRGAAFKATAGIIYPNVDPILKDHANLLAATVKRNADEAVTLWRDRMRTAAEEFLDLIQDGRALAEQRP